MIKKTAFRLVSLGDVLHKEEHRFFSQNTCYGLRTVTLLELEMTTFLHFKISGLPEHASSRAGVSIVPQQSAWIV